MSVGLLLVIRTMAVSLFQVRSMKVDRQDRTAKGIRFSISGNGREIARAYLYVMNNDLHDAPFGLLEDVFVDELQRGGGLGTALVQEVISAANELGCYKLIATSRTSRPKVHELYERLGFEKHGVEFRFNFDATTR
jgi:GNAT superfamily N-acetyltransferase